MTWIELVRSEMPWLGDDEAGYVLWNHTGFPSFWNIPADGETPEECCRTQLRRLSVADRDE